MVLVVAFRHGVIHIPETLGVHVRASRLVLARSPLGPGARRVLGAFLDCLTSPEYADVAPYFRRNGAACTSAPTCSAPRPYAPIDSNRRSSASSTGFTPESYEQLAERRRTRAFANSRQCSSGPAGAN